MAWTLDSIFTSFYWTSWKPGLRRWGCTGDGLAELLAGYGVFYGVVVGAHGDAGGQPTHEDAAVFEDDVGAFGEVFGLGELVAFRDDGVFEVDVAVLDGTQGHFVFDDGGCDTWIGCINNKTFVSIVSIPSTFFVSVFFAHTINTSLFPLPIHLLSPLIL